MAKPYLCEVCLPEGEPESGYPFRDGDTVLMLGKIENMPGHVVVVTQDGKTHFGYHVEHFRKLTADEI